MQRYKKAYQLPASLLLGLLSGLEVIILGDVTTQSAHHDHGHHAGEEEHNHEGVDDGEPVDLVVGHQEIGVPARGPLDVRRLCTASKRCTDRLVKACVLRCVSSALVIVPVSE